MKSTMNLKNFGRAALGLITLGGGLWWSTAHAQTPAPTKAPIKAMPSDVRELAAAVTKAGQDSAALSARYSGEFVSSQRSEVTARIGGRVKSVRVD